MSSTPRFTLFIGDMNLSSWSLRSWLPLKILQHPFHEHKIKLLQPQTRDEILRFSPAAKVPVLRDHENDLLIWDSLAINEYLAEQFPQAKLWPQDLKARASARCVSAEMHSSFAALRAQLPMHCHDAERERLARADQACQRDIERVVQLWQDCLQTFGGPGGMLFSHFTLADAMYAPVVIRFKTYGVPLKNEVADYANRIWELPAIQEWLTGAKTELGV